MSNNALQAYRAALRATRIAFNGDNFVLGQARTKIREGFETNRHLEAENSEKAIADIQEVSTFLVKNIVQGVKQDGEDRYALKFHKQTELGSNDTIKQGKAEIGTLAGAKGTKMRKCSDK